MSARELRSLGTPPQLTGPRRQGSILANPILLEANRRKRNNKARERRAEKRFFNNQTNEVTYQRQTLRQFLNILRKYEPHVMAGARFIVRYGGSYKMLTQNNFMDTKRTLLRRMFKTDMMTKKEREEYYLIHGPEADDYAMAGGGEESDAEIVEEATGGGGITISHVPQRNNPYTFPSGAYFPFKHDFKDKALKQLLHELGCYSEVNKNNYDDNCLLQAFRSAGVEEKKLNAMKTEFLRRTISRKNIRKIAEEQKLYITIKTEGDKNIIKYGDKRNMHVPIALIHGHYIHLFQTPYNSFAIRNYDQLHTRNEWHRYETMDRKRDTGMDTLKLLQTVLQTDHVSQISAADNRIFQTQFYDKTSMDFQTLEYDEKYCERYHPPRDGGYDLLLREPVERERVDSIIEYIKERRHSLVDGVRSNEKVMEILQWLIKYRECIEERGFVSVKYKYKFGGIGRLYAEGETKRIRGKNMQGCFKGLRPALLGDKAHDIDIENSLPAITVQFIHKLKQEKKISKDTSIQLLEHYVSNREEVIQIVREHHDCTRDEAKTLILIILFGGSSDNKRHIKDMKKNQYRFCPFLCKMDEELESVRKEVVNAHRSVHSELIEKRLEDKGGDEKAMFRSIFSILTHEEEKRIMISLMYVMRRNEIPIYSLVHDGVMVGTGGESLLREAEDEIERRTEYIVKLSEKPCFGKEDDPIPELECIKDVEPKKNYEEYGYATIRDILSKQLLKDRKIKIEKGRKMFTIENVGEVPGLWNRADGDPWDVMICGTKKLDTEKEYTVEFIEGILFMSNGNHKIFISVNEEECEDENKKNDQINDYISKYPPSVNETGRWVTDFDEMMEEEEEDTTESVLERVSEEEEDKFTIKYKKTMSRMRQTYPLPLQWRLDNKVNNIKLGKEEELKLWARSRPVADNIVFDFESSTKESLDSATTIQRCTDKIRNMENGEAKLVAIEEKVREKNLDEEGRARLYQEKCPHVAYGVAWSRLDGKKVKRRIGSDCATSFLNSLLKKYGVVEGKKVEVPVLRLIAHNLTYDMSFILPYLCRVDCIERGTSIVTGRCRYTRDGRSVDFRLFDSLKMIDMPLSDFGKSFNLDSEKECMPYELYTEEFVNNGVIATKEDLKNIPHFRDHDTLMKNIQKWDCEFIEGAYDMLKYSMKYCEIDVKVLRDGLNVFRNSLLEKFDVDCLVYPTISSLADAFMSENGVYDGVYKVGGVPRLFMTNASVGGRVMNANNEKSAYMYNTSSKNKKRTIQKNRHYSDYDARSLYPSAMERLGGYLVGKPKVWNKDVDISKCTGYFLKIRVTKVGRKWKFPICRVKTEEGGNRWTNDLDEEEYIYVDKWTLEDLVRHSDVEYEILQGYYYDEGRNYKIKEVISNLYDLRAKYKDEENPLQIVIKLMMNASYGICGLKQIETDTVYKEEHEHDNYVALNYNRIKDYTRMPNGNWRFDIYKEVDSHYNRIHVACEILSMSKTIMNEVTCTAEEIGAHVAYTDTDSLQMETEGLGRLKEEFFKRYGKELDGKKLGQFHTDFEFSKCYQKIDGELVRCKTKSVGEVVAQQSIFLGKKSYIHELTDAKGNLAYHIRMKSIPGKVIQSKASEEYRGDVMALFKELYEGGRVEFDLCTGGNVCFKTNKNHHMTTSSIIRSVQF
jgi:inorganic pyrophosphatase